MLTIALLVVFIEVRVGLQFVSTALGVNWRLPDCDLDSCSVFSVSKP